jgi:hypothetical protein
MTPPIEDYAIGGARVVRRQMIGPALASRAPGGASLSVAVFVAAVSEILDAASVGAGVVDSRPVAEGRV